MYMYIYIYFYKLLTARYLYSTHFFFFLLYLKSLETNSLLPSLHLSFLPSFLPSLLPFKYHNNVKTAEMNGTSE